LTASVTTSRAFLEAGLITSLDHVCAIVGGFAEIGPSLRAGGLDPSAGWRRRWHDFGLTQTGRAGPGLENPA